MALLLLATTNPGKLLEMQSLLAGLPLELALPASFGIRLDVIEDGATYAENAAKKALAFSIAANLPALADDSGLEVDILSGEPGLHSHRYSPLPNATDADRRTYLLACLADKPRPWQAHFHCTVAIALPTGELFYADGNCPGEIIPTQRGENGFGYDPIFLLTESRLTMAELSMEDKNRLSHRARAIHAALPILHRLFLP